MSTLSGCMTRGILGILDRVVGEKTHAADHLITGQRGEEDAYFYLRRLGYVIVARNYRTARHHGEIDLIGWDQDVLCFIEVKTRTTREVKPAEAAVDRKKRQDLRIVIRDYLRSLPRKQFPELPQWRLDVVSVYYEREVTSSPAGACCREDNHPLLAKAARSGAPAPVTKPKKGPAADGIRPTFELFRNAVLSS